MRASYSTHSNGIIWLLAKRVSWAVHLGVHELASTSSCSFLCIKVGASYIRQVQARAQVDMETSTMPCSAATDVLLLLQRLQAVLWCLCYTFATSGLNPAKRLW